MMSLRPALAVLALLVAWNPPSWGESPQSFQASKRLLAGIHEDIEHQLSLYCGCPYERKGRSGGDIDRQTCGLSARKNGKALRPDRTGARGASFLDRRTPRVLERRARQVSIV